MMSYSIKQLSIPSEGILESSLYHKGCIVNTYNRADKLAYTRSRVLIAVSRRDGSTFIYHMVRDQVNKPKPDRFPVLKQQVWISFQKVVDERASKQCWEVARCRIREVDCCAIEGHSIDRALSPFREFVRTA